ncbi:hypothetical protein F4X33_07125 [Candidatus Poribacteria bacterium]|nr:hypothetical protein [Candidatus Poribacteria bacterium]
MVTLEGIYAKLHRAQDQIEQLSRDIANSCETLRLSFSEELRPDVGDRIWIFRGETPVVPIEYSVRLGEIVYNLRSSLDQLIWQLVHANYKAPSHRNEFPIFDDESRFNKVVKTKLAGVSQQSLATIKEMQPFLKDDKWSALKIVHSLCNIDKHRSVILPFYMLDRCSVTYRGGGDPGIKPLVRSSRSSMQPELRKDMIAYSVQPPDAIFEINLFIDMKLKDFDGLDPEKYLDMKSNEQQVILVLRDCMSTIRTSIDCLSGEIEKHPLFGRRPSLYGIKSVNISMEGLVDALAGELKQQYLRDLYGLPDLTIDSE